MQVFLTHFLFILFAGKSCLKKYSFFVLLNSGWLLLRYKCLILPFPLFHPCTTRKNYSSKLKYSWTTKLYGSADSEAKTENSFSFQCNLCMMPKYSVKTVEWDLLQICCRTHQDPCMMQIERRREKKSMFLIISQALGWVDQIISIPIFITWRCMGLKKGTKAWQNQFGQWNIT